MSNTRQETFEIWYAKSRLSEKGIYFPEFAIRSGLLLWKLDIFSQGFIAKRNQNNTVTILYVKGYEVNLEKYGLNKDYVDLETGRYAISLKEVDKHTFDKEYGYKCYDDGRTALLKGYKNPVITELQELQPSKAVRLKN